MGAPVSASSSRTLRPTLDDTPMRVVALASSAETRVAGVGTMAGERRRATTLNLNVTGSARGPGADTTTREGPAAGGAPGPAHAPGVPGEARGPPLAPQLPPARRP